MKPKHSLIFKLLTCFLITALLPGCRTEVGTWQNDQIKGSISDELHDLNKQVFRYIRENDTKKLERYLSKELIEDVSTVRTADRISHQMRKDSFVRFNEYYVMNKYIERDTITAAKQGINSYQLIYPGTTQEMYITLLVPKDSKSPNLPMITAVYSNFNYGWKLSKLDMALYKINGKTAPELYELAKREYKNNYLISATNTMMLATTCARPNEIWQYNVEEDLYKFSGKLIKEANAQFEFPVTLDKVSSKPTIISMYNDTSDEGTYPIICYLTKVNLKDTAAINRENAEVKKVIDAVLPGIDKNKKQLIYYAYNQRPNRNMLVPHAVIIDKLQ